MRKIIAVAALLAAATPAFAQSDDAPLQEGRSAFEAAPDGATSAPARAHGWRHAHRAAYGGEYGPPPSPRNSFQPGWTVARVEPLAPYPDDRFPYDPSCHYGAQFHVGRDGVRYLCR